MGTVDVGGVSEKKPDVMEVFSVPRVCARADHHGLLGGPSYEINPIPPHDIRYASVRAKIRKEIETLKPLFLVGSPPVHGVLRLDALQWLPAHQGVQGEAG